MSLLSRLAVQAARAYGILSSNPNNVSADYLVVAGGGGGAGGTAGGGGGGAGGMLTSTATLSILNTYSIAVGAGGNGGAVNTIGSQGNNSSISGTGLSTITSTGGGYGGYNNVAAGSGGSGGGGGGRSTTNRFGGAGTSGQGYAGGDGLNDATNQSGAGGGGAGAVGGAASGSSTGGAGGNGSASSISGSSVTYAGGGGGAGYYNTSYGSLSNGGLGGSGGGGTANSAGTVNLGGGGGGGGGSAGGGGAGAGAAGGSGIVIISYTSATPKFVGGTITTSGGKQIHTFTSSGTLSPITPITASYLVVAGGAGGGGNYHTVATGGGGGAGGLLTSSTTLYSGATYVVTVGAGGAGGTGGAGTNGTNGTNSTVSGTGLTTLTAVGGGYGATNQKAGGSGGSGGGASGPTTPGSFAGGTGTAGQGNDGGSANQYQGAGGGGAGAVGASGATGLGGAGLASSISGTSTYYAGGGGTTTASLGGGGIDGGSGTTNTGGGGGRGASGANNPGGSGGSGIVIISYAGSQVFNGGLVTSSGGNTIHTFTSTGALTPLTNNLNNSLRFRSSASANLSKTFSTGGTSRQIQTCSLWVKRGTLGSTYSYMIGAYDGSSGFDAGIQFLSDNLCVQVGGVSSTLTTTQVFRDPSAWYHIVVAIDTTQATAANRVKVYVNGNQVTAFSTATYPTQNANINFLYANSNNRIGTNWNNNASTYFDGYMTDINFIDGQALEPYYFGNNDANGVWKPIQYKGTYGTNGFYLTFGNTTSTTTLGYDSSPNGNNWTCNNISLTAGTTYDAMLDVPTNTSATVANYAVLNPLSKGTNVVLSQANLKYDDPTGSTGCGAFSTIGMTSGKFYCEATVTGTDVMVGLSSSQDGQIGYVGINATGWGYYSLDGKKYNNGSSSTYGATYTTNDVIGIAFDADAGTLTFYKNNTSQGTAFSSLTSGPYYFATGNGAAGTDGSLVFNFGQRPFSYTPPTGYVALNTYNLPTPTILQGNKYMDATLYSGTGAAQVIVNQGQFKPDLVWIKSRNNITNNNLTDSVRGVTKIAFSNSANAEATASVGLTSFDNNGFSLATGGDVGFSASGYTYVGWQWQAGQGTTSSNTSGSVTSTTSVNTTSGFSIVTYTGPGSGGGTVGHGLGVAPKMIIVKNRSAAESWRVGHAFMNGGTNPWNYYMNLNGTVAQTAASSVWNNTAPTSTVFSIANDAGVSGSGNGLVAYCFAEISGFSAFGSYTGNGSTDGTFVYLGFLPKFILTKGSSATTDWVIHDTSRNTYNVANLSLYPNTSGAETTLEPFDILSNGFKLRTTAGNVNNSGTTYIYAAFAENPFKNSNAR